MTSPTGTLRYQVVHALPGRLRVRIDELASAGFAEQLTTALMRHPGILGVRVNCWCASAVIIYDPTMLSPPEAVRTLAATPVDAVARVARSSPAGVATQPEPTGNRLLALAERLMPPLGQLALGAVAFGAGLLGIAPPLTIGLLGAAIAPIVVRMLRTAVNERRAGVDLLDASAAGLLIARGNLVAAGFMALLIGLGEFIRERTARRSQALVSDLLGLGGRSAWVVHGDRRVRVPADRVRVGETVVVYPGDMVPVDGVVLRGRAAVDQRSLTGESMPLELGPGDRAYAASVVVEGKVYMTCKAAGADTRAGMVAELVRTAPLAETRTQNYAARLADRLVLPTFLLAGCTYALTRDLLRAAAVLIIDFATGIRIAAPTAVLASMQRAARRGILIKGGGAVERLASVDAVLLDKTGTLTHGEPRVTEVFSVNGFSPREVLVLAAAAEQRLRHPTARAIVRHARWQGLDVPDRTDSSYTLGMGVHAHVEGLTVLVGRRRWLESEGVSLAAGEAVDAAARRRRESHSYVAVDGQLVGIITYADLLRREAPDTVAGLRRRGVRKIIMVTGDNQAVAWAAARVAGIDQVVAGAFPQRKAEIVQELKASGHTVAVVGDGINDSPALAYADVAVSLRGGADVARERADVVLTDDDLGRLTEAIDIAREAMRLVRQGIATVVGSNTAGMVLGTTGLIGPGGATLANNGSAVVAALQSLQPLLSDPAVPEAPPS